MSPVASHIFLKYKECTKVIPVIIPATVIGVFHPSITALRSKKKNAVAARQPIDINQNENPTKSSGLRSVDAFASPELRVNTIKTNKIFFIFYSLKNL